MYTRRGWRKYSLLFICFFTFIFTYGQNSLNKNASQLKALRFQTDQYKSQKHYPQYINTLFQLKRQYEEHKDFSSLAYILSEIGDVYFQWGVYEKAVDYYERASDPSYAQYLSSSDQRTIALKTADANRLLGSYTKAQNNYENIYKRWGLDLSEKEKLNIVNHLAHILKKTEQYNEAVPYEKKVLEFQLAFKDSAEIANAYNNLGATLKKLNRNEEALTYFQKAYAYYPSHSSKDNLAIILLNLGIACQTTGDYIKAFDYFTKALEWNKKQNNAEETGRTYNYIASNYLFLKEYSEAILFAEKAEQIAQSKKLFALMEISCRILWQAHELQKDNESALESYRKYVAVKDTILHHNQIEEQQLTQRLREAEKLENRIQTLLSENELQQAELSRVQLESRNKATEIELIQRHNELNVIRAKQVQLQQEKEIDRLHLVEQTLIRQSRERELMTLKEHVAIENREKQAKMEALHQQNLIKQLEINQKEISLRNQRLVQYLLLLALIAGTVLTFLLFNRYKLSQKAVKEKLKRKNTEIEQRFLRAQMNPHFIFNALNSIQYYITSNDNPSAARYLAKFSKLVRHILESSRHRFIPIQEEIKILHVYLELEQLRFSNKFDYSIHLGDSLEDDFITIPPMITQPYIENAILHGVVHLPEKGRIYISFTKSNNCIECTIRDNGIGREASALMREKLKTTHRSLAMELTKDRLELMKHTLKGEYKIIITDLQDTQGRASGTEVKVWIPYLET
jgi:tetratricopeptide (TPR) repeat protein